MHLAKKTRVVVMCYHLCMVAERRCETMTIVEENLKWISVALNGKSVDLSKVVSMIDETVALLKAEWGEDDGKKAYCTESFGQTEDESTRPRS